MAVQVRDGIGSVDAADVSTARELLAQIYDDELRFPNSPITPDLVRINIEHAEQVRLTAATIAKGEGLDRHLLELAAVLHDVAKLDHRDRSSGGIDTWHHHHRGASLARKLLLVDLGKSAAVADAVANMIDVHSDIPFISRYWQTTYRTKLPTPRTAEELALRDADIITLLWVSGISKIVHFRQVPGSDYHREDGGDIQNAIASARISFDESVASLVTDTGRRLAANRVEYTIAFFERIAGVADLREFGLVYEDFIRDLRAVRP
jgi:hypothetical protein